MDQAAASRFCSRVLSEIDPHSEWIRGEEFDTLVLDVTGFRKEHLKVQVEPSGSLKISGERAVNGGDRHWLHFLKRFDLPPGDAAAIKVQLDKGVLYVQMPVPHPSAASDDGSDGEQQRRMPELCDDDELRQEGEMGSDAAAAAGGWSGGRAVARRDGHPAWQLARAVSRHRQVVLNVVIAVVLLWFVAFASNKQSSGFAKN